MNTINAIFRYIGYAAVSIILGWVSYCGKVDFISQIGGTVLTVMLALLSLYVTLSSLLITQMVDLHKQETRFKIDGTIDAMKRNVNIEVILLVASLVVLSVKSFILSAFPSLTGILSVGSNSVIVFSVLYFILVIYDSFTGLFKIIKIKGSV